MSDKTLAREAQLMSAFACSEGSKLERYLLRETYAAHQVFMNVGYEAEEIFVSLAPGLGEAINGDEIGGRWCWSVRLERDGLTFTLLIAAVTEEEGERFLEKWDEFARHGKRAASIATLDALLYESDTYRRHVELLHAMSRKGFKLRPLGSFQ